MSVGNVGQLSADLLIQALKCEKAGYIWHPAILPVVGVDPYRTSSSSLALSAEGKEIFMKLASILLFVTICV